MKNVTIHKLLVGIAALVLMAGMLQDACTPKPGSAPEQAPAAIKTKLRYSGALAPTHPISIKQQWFADEISKRTAGQVTVEVYTGGQLYKHAQCVDAVSSGALEMGTTPVGQWAMRNPVFGFQSFWLLLESTDHYGRSKAKLDEILAPLFEEQNVKLVHSFALGDSCYAGNKPLVKPEDMKGIIIRGPNPESNEFLKALGAVPASMDESEQYDGLSKKAIDGLMNAWSNIYSRKLFEVTKYYTGPLYSSSYVCFMNLDVWKKLPPDTQKRITEVGKEADAASFKEAKAYDLDSLEVLKKAGTLTILNAEQIAGWLKVTRPFYDQWAAKCEKAGYGRQARDIIRVLNETR